MAPRDSEGDAVVAGAGEHDRGAQRLELALRLLGDGEVHVLLQRAGRARPRRAPRRRGPGSSTTWAPVSGVAADRRLAAARRSGDERPVGVRTEHRQHHAGRGDHRARRSAGAAPATAIGGAVVVVLGGAVVVVATPWSSWRRGRGRASAVARRRPRRAASARRRRRTPSASTTSATPSSARTGSPRRSRCHAPRGRAAARRGAQRLLDDLDHERAGLGGVLARPATPAACERLHLGRGRALAARHDGAGVAHLLAGRGGDAGDVGRRPAWSSCRR